MLPVLNKSSIIMLEKSVQVNYDLEHILESASEYKGTVVKNTQFPNHMYSCHVMLYRCSLTDSNCIRKWSSVVRGSDTSYITADNKNTCSEHSHSTDTEAVISCDNKSSPSYLKRARLSEQYNNTKVFERIVESGSIRQYHVAKLKKWSDFTCTHCQVIFSNSAELKLHFEVHNGEFPLACTDCGEIFVSLEKLTLHKESCSPAFLKCAVSQKAFTIKDELYEHITPNLCDVQTHAGTNYKKNILTSLISKLQVKLPQVPYPDEHLLTRTNGGKVIANDLDLANRNYIHNRDRRFQCLQCSKQFQSSSHLNDHIMHMHSDVRAHTCTQCGKTFVTARNCKKHFQRVHGKDFSFVCSHCGEVFVRNEDLNIHKESCVTKALHMCMLCTERFTSKIRLQDHLKRQHGQSGVRPFQCAQCGTKFLSSSHLKGHMLQVHTKIRPYICTRCSRGFTTTRDCAKHERVCGGERNERPHACSQCNKKFSLLASLKIHTRVHDSNRKTTGSIGDQQSLSKSGLADQDIDCAAELTFPCLQCSKIFPRSASLKLHTLTVHDKEHVFICTVCSKTFSQNCNLKRHMLAHSADKPHACTECEQRFTQISSLNAHLLIHKGVRPHVCPICRKSFTQSSSLRTHRAVHRCQLTS